MLTPLYYTQALLRVSTLKGPDGAVVQNQPSLQSSCLIFFTPGQYESCNRNYYRIRYIYIYLLLNQYVSSILYVDLDVVQEILYLLLL